MGNDFNARLQGFWRGNAHVHAHQAAQFQQGIARITTCIACVGIGNLLQRLVCVLAHGEQVGQHLGRMPFVGQAIVNRHACVFGQFFDDVLTKATVFNRIVHAAQHAGGVFDAFFVANLAARWAQIRGAGTLVGSAHFKCATGTGGGFFKNQGHVFAAQLRCFAAIFFSGFEFCGQCHQRSHFFGAQIGQF